MRAAWTLLALFIVYGSWGTWSLDGPRRWAITPDSIPDLTQNMLLYLPFGMLGALAFKVRPVSRRAIAMAALAACAFSVVVECLQLYIPDRTASVLDIAAATAGAAMGAFAAERVARYAEVALASLPAAVFDGPAGIALVFVSAAYVAVSWWPFSITLDVSTLSERARAVRWDPWVFDRLSLLASVIVFGLLAWLVAPLVTRLGRARGVAATMLALGAFAIFADAGQLAMGSRPVGLAGFCAQIGGALVGAGVSVIWRSPR